MMVSPVHAWYYDAEIVHVQQAQFNAFVFKVYIVVHYSTESLRRVYLLSCVGKCAHGCKIKKRKAPPSSINRRSSSARCSNLICYNSKTAGACCQGLYAYIA